MGLITEEVEVGLRSTNIKYFEELGYIIPRKKNKYGYFTVNKGTKILIKVYDLKDNSNIEVKYRCDNCGKELTLKYYQYNKHKKEDGSYFCHICSIKLYGTENLRVSLLKNSLNFEKWCITNEKLNILERWDYKLNELKPSEISYSTSAKRIWFKCPKGIHKSELKNIHNITRGQEGSIKCNQCNSFAQLSIDNLGEDFLEKYWDYNKNTSDPFIMSAHTNKKVWIKCQEKKYHDSYDISCSHFVSGKRCPYCTNKKVHVEDSLGYLYSQTLEIWSNKNQKTPFDYAPFSNKYIWWKCKDNNKHKEYYRTVCNSQRCKFRCPECDYSKGESRANNYLINNYVYYIPQKTFEGLVGVNKGLLSYDFYLPEYNLLIEYQGVQHEKYVLGLHKSEKDFKKQQEHDRRKREYAKNNNIELLEIWYWDFENIEEILSKKLSLK